MDAAKNTAPPPNGKGQNETIDHRAYIESLSLLSKLDYECKRLQAAEALGFRVSVLDELVGEMHPKEAKENDLQGREIIIPDIEPWSESVNGAEVLHRLIETIELYLVLPPGAAVVMALWCLATYLYDCFGVFPRLYISSPTKRCGKSLLKDVLSLFCQRACKTEDATAAALFRIIPRSRPTVFWDEFDTLGEKVDELRALLNAGHCTGGEVWRCVGSDFEPRAFDVFCPVCVIGIGVVYETLLDRSITVRMERATRAEIKKRKRFNFRDLETEKNLARQLARFAADIRAAVLAHGDPILPEEIYNREADNLRPLATLAEILGEGWPLRLITAYANLCGDESFKGESDGLRIELLRDIYEVLREYTEEKIFSEDLKNELCRLPDRPWRELNRGKDISSTWLSKQLRSFRILSKSVRIGEETKKGYAVADFTEVFERYLDTDPHVDVFKRHSVTEPINTDESEELETSHGNECDGAKSNEKPLNIDVCRRDVSNAENGNGHKSATADSDLAWICWREKRLRELGKTEAEIRAMTAEEKDEFLFHTF